jgi:hypothetical protein
MMEDHMGLNLAKLSGGTTAISQETLDALKARVRGIVLTDHDEGYDAARSVWNAMIDRRPGIIVRCAGAADVMAAVDFARETGAVLSVRGGGHNIAGSAVCDNGVMVDLSPMKSVRIDPFARTARVEPGVTLGELDREAQSFGLVTPTGINSTTGIAGGYCYACTEPPGTDGSQTLCWREMDSNFRFRRERTGFRASVCCLRGIGGSERTSRFSPVL